MWNPNENSNDENMRWCHLRAIEWTSWPLFVAQPIAPVALLFFSWWNVALVVFGASVFWVFVVRDKIVIPSLAYWGCLVVRLKWILCPVAACILAYRGTLGIAALALLWPVATLLLQMIVLPLKPVRIGDIEMMFVRSLGYRSVDD